MRPLLLVFLTLAALACRPLGAAPAASTPVTSAGDPTAPVPFEWSTHTSHRPDGHRLHLQGGTLHAIPSEVRLVSPTGQTIASAPAVQLTDSDDGLCGERRGVARADLPLPAADIAKFRDGWPAGYRVEVLVGGVWRPAQLTFAGCVSIE